LDVLFETSVIVCGLAAWLWFAIFLVFFSESTSQKSVTCLRFGRC